MKKRIRTWIAFTLFIAGVVIIIYPHISKLVYNHIQKNEAKKYHEQLSQLHPEVIKKRVVEAEKCNEAIYENEDNLHDPFTEDFRQHDYEACAEMLPHEGEQFASLELPKLDLTIPIYLGDSQSILAKGVGQVNGSSLPVGGESTHTVLAGHRTMSTKTMFQKLDDLEPGDTFYIHTLHEKMLYKVYNVEVILPHETDNLVVFEGKDLASLITCHPYGNNTHRLVVHGERVN